MKTKPEIIKGMFWHCHHDMLCEWVYDYQERVNRIKSTKPKNEIETRLRLFKAVKGKLPAEVVKAGEKCEAAGEKCDEAREKYNAAWEKYYAAREKYYAAKEKYNAAWEKYYAVLLKYKPQLEKLHKKECGCKEWNGEKMVFGK